MSFCFNNREGNVEIKCWWSGLSDLCYLLDKASLSGAPSRERRQNHQDGGLETDTTAAWGWPWRLGEAKGSCSLMWLEMPHKLESYEEGEGTRFTLGKCISPECSLCSSAWDLQGTISVFPLRFYMRTMTDIYSRFETSKLNESVLGIRCIKDGVCLRFLGIEFKFFLFLVFIFICPACGS